MHSERAVPRREPRQGGTPSLTAVCLLAGATAVTAGWLTSVSPLIPWVILATLALAYVVLARPQLFVLVLVAILPWQGALRFPTHNLTIVKLVGALLMLAVLLNTLLTDRRLRLTPVVVWAVLLCASVTLSLLVNDPSAISVTETLRYWSLALFLFLVVQLIDGHESALRAVRVLALSAIVGAAWASVQFLSGSVQRASGPISDPNDFAYLLAVVLPFVVYLYATEPPRRWLWGAGLALLALGILGSSSRGAFVALAATALWAIFTRRVSARAVALALATVAMLAVLALGISSAKTARNLQVREHGLSTSVSLRRSYWSAAIRMSANHPLFGVGPGRFEAQSSSYVRDTPVLEHEIAVNNSYLAMLSETGGVATLLFIGLLVAIWRQIVSATPRARASTGAGPPLEHPRAPEHWLRSTLLAAFVVALVGGLFFSAQLSTPLWFLAAFASALSFRALQPTGAPS